MRPTPGHANRSRHVWLISLAFLAALVAAASGAAAQEGRVSARAASRPEPAPLPYFVARLMIVERVEAARLRLERSASTSGSERRALQAEAEQLLKAVPIGHSAAAEASVLLAELRVQRMTPHGVHAPPGRDSRERQPAEQGDDDGAAALLAWIESESPADRVRIARFLLGEAAKPRPDQPATPLQLIGAAARFVEAVSDPATKGLARARLELRRAVQRLDSGDSGGSAIAGGSCAENGSCFGDLSDSTGRPKTVRVREYYRADGTYVRGHYRSRRGR